MKWTEIWMNLFGTVSLFKVNMGFWVGLAAVLLIVVLMNAVFWNMKPKKESET